MKVLIEGLQRAVLVDVHDDGVVMTGIVKPQEDNERELVDQVYLQPPQVIVLIFKYLRALDTQFTEYAILNERLSSDVLGSIRGLSYPGRLADLISIHLPLSIEHKQNILETIDVHDRVELVLSYLKKKWNGYALRKIFRKSS